MNKQYRIVFVCLGNICRSPSAEAVFTKLVNDRGLAENFVIDSAATGSWHVGEPADARMQRHATKRGYQLTSIARQFVATDFERFDYVIGMDGNNVDDIRMLDRRNEHSEKIAKMTDYCREYTAREVPDPYYGGAQGFERVLDILEDACSGLLDEIV